MMSEGRYVFNSATVFYPEFAITDHLGNVRVAYTNNNGVATLKQSFSYYPYGMCRGETISTPINANEYLYQGKEYDEEHGINMYDFHARMYDPALGCWHVPDPMHQYVSGYVAMGDNPVSFVDPDGMRTGWVRDILNGLNNLLHGDPWSTFRFNPHKHVGKKRKGDSIIGNYDGDDYYSSYNDYSGNADLGITTGESGGFGGGGGGGHSGGDVGGSHTAYVAPHNFTSEYTESNQGHGSNQFNSENTHSQFAPSPWSGAFSHSQGNTSSAVISNINVTHNILGWITSIEGVQIRYLNFFNRSAFTLPGVGIFANYSCCYDIQLFMHEFGHVLQARKWGIKYFYDVVGPTSVLNFNKYYDNWWIYNRTWTEWSANLLSYNYFLKPKWNFDQFPISPESSDIDPFSPDSNGPGDFLLNWIY